ncbi:MAG: hypothetical protein L3K18_08410 [Thermoplasmata archaeon]|nr:hypothetical protein [Thermoplasmata archaeon]MCI4357138.1 hypothetical protein [Thermoplasmata archaeon]
MLGSRFGGGIALAGVAGLLVCFALAGIGGAATSSGTSNAALAPALHTACPATLTASFTPTVLRAYSPMAGHIGIAFPSAIQSACSASMHISVVGLPGGCAPQTTQNFACIPMMAGTFHVLTTVLAQNTATTIVDTVVVR